MGQCVWTDDLSVGVPEVDADHKVLIELIGFIESAGRGAEERAVLGTALNALLDYTEYHFGREEKMQEVISYPGFADHKMKHDRLKEQVVDFRRRYDADPAAVDIADLSQFLNDWLVQHIQSEDFAYRPYAKDNPKAREAMASIGLDFFLEDEDENTLM